MPESPQVGESYPAMVYSHCGIEFVRFGGQYWQADDPAAAPDPRPNSDGIVTIDGYTPGTMTLVDQNTLKFTVDDNAVIQQGIVVTFHPTAHGRAAPCA